MVLLTLAYLIEHGTLCATDFPEDDITVSLKQEGCVLMSKSHYIFSPNDGYLGRVYNLAIVSSASTNNVVLVFLLVCRDTMATATLTGENI